MYEKVFATTSPVELHGAYIWSVKAAASIQPLLSTLEVALRNSIHNSATNLIAADWYDKLNTKQRKSWKVAQRDKNNIIWHKSEVARVKKKLAQKKPPDAFGIHPEVQF